ncbi:LysE family translocator [Vogesella sp. LIG4]|uniref:LysE family translocator n=1 Tax=Vogesella sp. LIG4 TaxID=1192162 RepID=UPI001E2AFB91|nr:LysE family translocator [Vogesella sp. LIG4]
MAAAIGLSLTPGPNGLLALTHGALYGHRKTLYTVSGGVIGFVVLIGLSMCGIGALLQASAQALTLLKLVGGAYLVWLGIQLWRAPALRLSTDGQAPARRGRALFGQGFISAISNPKALLFYGAFLSQFIDPQRGLWPQFVIMAGTFAVIEFCVECLLARLAHRIRPRLERSGKRFNQSCGGLFMLAGAVLTISH